ncbi:MAG: cytochrome c biogenesis protein ResB [Candidatus Azobacteroides sp.]|nr:cytochrome c biogenesis protein ResB [Candidatus Azobacteroides sp.]
MWKQTPGYIEGWTICSGLFITGIVLQLYSGKIAPDLLHFPINLISGVLFLIGLLLFHLISIKVKGIQWFAGYAAAVTSLSSLLLLVIIMGLTRQLPSSYDLSRENGFVRTGFMQMTVSWPFILLMLYFLWILGLVVLRRLSRFKWKDTGFVFNHLGLFIALFGAVWGSADLQRLRMTVSMDTPEWRATNEKNETVELPLAIELKAFTIDEYPPKLMLLDNITGEALPKKEPVNVSVETCPFEAELLDWKLEIVKDLPYAAGISNSDTLNYVEFHGEGATSALYVKAHNVTDDTRKEGWVSCGNYLFPYASLRLNEKMSLIMPEREPKRYASDVMVYTKSGDSKEASIEVNKPLSVAGWKIYQLSYDETLGKWSRYSVFELVKDPWLPVVYSGIGMMLVGAVFLFISAPKKI